MGVETIYKLHEQPIYWALQVYTCNCTEKHCSMSLSLLGNAYLVNQKGKCPLHNYANENLRRVYG